MATTAALITGCGTPAVPQAPSLYLPQPPTDLTAVRNGNDVTLHWTMTKHATDRAPLKGDQQAHICRSIAGSPCDPAGDAAFALGAEASFVDHLPPALASGSPRLIAYTIELRNHRGRTAGPSNAAYSAVGAAPDIVQGISQTPRPDGVLLHWQSSQSAASLVRLHREQVLSPGESKKASSSSVRQGAEVPLEQTLEVQYANGSDPGRTLDKDAAFDKTYRYTLQRVNKLTINGQSFEVASAPSEPLTVEVRDSFPPAVPQGIVTVASTDDHSIDLSWSPNTENDLAGYIVYRRSAGSTAAPTRISPSEPVPGPSFHDATAQPGTRYAYSVSAIDHDGNESARSAETEETLPQ